MKFIICFIVTAMVLSSTAVSAVSSSAKATVVINADSGEIIYSHNCDERLPMASTTKIMSAWLLCEYDDLEREITATKEMVTVEGSSMGLLAGDKVKLRDLVYGMLLPSGNDAANTAAIATSGSVEAFVDKMNKRAQDMGLKDTHFVTPSGLDADEHYTTAYELALITREALKNPVFAKAVSSKTATLYYGNPPYRRTLTNHNKLLRYYDDVIGVKTGFTKKSGRCLVSAASKDGATVIAVTLNDPNDWQDHRALLDYGLSQIKKFSITPEINDTLTVLGSNQKLRLTADTAELSLSENSEPTYKISLPPFVHAPINKGDIVGKIDYYNKNEHVLSAPVFAAQSITEDDTDRVYMFFALFRYILSCI